MQEIWKDIQDYEGWYQVSNLGGVRSLDRYLRNGRGFTVYKGKNLAVNINNKQGYKQVRVRLCKKQICKTKVISRLVAQAFIPNIENKPYVNHIDFDSTNNIVTNLEWCTHLENIRHSKNNGRYDNPYRIITSEQENDLISTYLKYGNINTSAKIVNVHYSRALYYITKYRKRNNIEIPSRRKIKGGNQF